ncbi:heat shock protein HtpX [Halosimplex carlsbadense 2-9-1]|uniref:Heat shock protein HtpX n=2 Tax=Halosimplex carlsbadense TaxID=171164 RepID=M0CEM3_9EURY|nr:heat shock protein HtpX [Halosimplex carlsbadense 2-9-1]
MALAVAALTVVAALLVAFEGLLFGFVSYWFLLLASGLLELFLGTAALGLVGAVVGYAAVLGVVFLAYHAAVTTERGFDVAPNLLGYAFVGSLIASLGVTFVVLDRLGTPGWAFALVLVTLVASVYPFMLFQIARERSEDDGSDEDEDPPWATEGDEAPWQVDSDSPPWVDDGSDDDGDENGSDDERGLDRTPLDTVRTLAGHAWTLLTGFVDRTGLLGVAGALVLASGTLAGVYVAAIRWSADELVRPLAALIALVLTTGHLAALVRSELADSAALGAFDEAYRTVEDPERRRALQARVERLAAQADVPAPRVRFVASTEPTAAAVGYRPGESTLVLSTGLVEALDDRELDAVVAHELAHVANHDAAVLTALSFPRVNAERLFDRYGINPVVSLLAGFVALTGRFCTAVVARAREYVADDGAAAMTGDPAALASALETLDARLGRRPTEDLRSAATAFGIVPPPWEEHRFFDRTRRLIFRRLLGTHPATEDRVERLRRAAAERES